MGWYKESAYITPFSFDEPITGDVTIFARWEFDTSNYCYVDFHLNDGLFPITALDFFISTNPSKTQVLGVFNTGYMTYYKESIFLFKTGYVSNDWAVEVCLNRNEDGLYEVVHKLPAAAGSAEDLSAYEYILVGHDAYSAGYGFLNTLTVGQIITVTGFDVLTAEDGPLDPPATVNVYSAGTEISFSEVLIPLETALPVPFKDHYSFAGWYDNPDFSGEPITETAEDATLYAKWDPIMFDIEFIDGETEYKVDAVQSGATVDEPVAPSKEGYTFRGWFLDLDDEESFDFTTVITSEFILYAKWDINSYEVVFMDGEEETAKETVEYNAVVTPPFDMVKEGYVFLGWFVDLEDEAAFDFATPITTDLILHAKWEEVVAATVTWDAVYDATRESWYIKVALAGESLALDYVKTIEVIIAAGEYIEPISLVPDTDAVLRFGVAGANGLPTLKEDGVYAFRVVRQDDSYFVFTFEYKNELVTGLPIPLDANVDYDAVWNGELGKWYIKVSVPGEVLDIESVKAISWVMSAGVYIDPVELTPNVDTDLWFSVAGANGLPVLKEAGIYMYEVTRSDDSIFVFAFVYNPNKVMALPDIITATVDYNAVWNDTLEKWFIKVSLDEDLDADSVLAIALIMAADVYIDPVELIPDTDKVLWFGVADIAADLAYREAGCYRFEVKRNDESIFVFEFVYEPDNVTGLKHIVEFDTMDEVVVVKVDVGSKVTAPDVSRPGYEFVGWYVDAEYNTEFDFETEINQNLILYAAWDAIVYEAIFHLNEGEFKYPFYETKNDMIDAFLSDFYDYVNPSESLSDFMHGADKTEGYDGTWHSVHQSKIYSSDRPTEVNEAYFISSSDYMDKWLPFFDIMEEFVNGVNPDQHFYGDSFTGLLRIKVYVMSTKPWSYVPDSVYELFPQEYKPIKYTIESEAIPLPQVVREGHTFVGWYSNPEFTGVSFTEIPAGTHDALNLYAKWEEDSE